jgi:HK97 family phage portal protein
VRIADRIKGWLGASEGSYRPAYGIGELGGWYELGNKEADGFQRNLSINGGRHNASVYSCVMLSARAASQCEPQHLQGKEGDWIKSETSPASRILRIPNNYETWSLMLLNTVAEMLFNGECLWLAVRDSRYAITSVHRVGRGCWSIQIDPDTKEIFYAISNTEMIEQPDYLVPARDVAHFRQHCPRHPLIGESPIAAAALAVGINVALSRSQLAFFSQMNRPSGIVSTEQNLTAQQMVQLREAFDKQSKLWEQGGLPILGGGLKFQPMGVAQNDSQLIEQQKLSIAEIARVFGVPSALISDATGTMAGTEALISHWLSVGLGSILETIEETLERLFQLGADERIELDPSPLLRVDFAGRISGLVSAVQGGLLTPAEARAKEGYGNKDGADELYLQRQMTPLSLINELNIAELKAKANPAPAAPVPVDTEADDTAESDSGKGLDPEITKALVFDMMSRKRKAA